MLRATSTLGGGRRSLGRVPGTVGCRAPGRARGSGAEGPSRHAVIASSWSRGGRRAVPGRGEAPVEQVARDRDARRPARSHGRVDAAGRERRDEAGRVADEHRVAQREGPHGAAHRDQPAPGPRAPCARKVDYRGDPFEEPAEIGTCRLPAREPDLRDADAGNDPPDVAGSELRVEEDMEPIRHSVDVEKLDLDAPKGTRSSLPVPARAPPSSAGRRRPRASAPFARRLGTPARTGSRRPPAPPDRPWHGAVRGCRSRGSSSRGRRGPPTAATVRTGGSRGSAGWSRAGVFLVGSLLHEESGRSYRVAGVGFALPHDGPETSCRARAGTSEPCESRPHDLHIDHRRQRYPRMRSGGSRPTASPHWVAHIHNPSFHSGLPM